MGTLENPTLKNLHARFGTIPKQQNLLLQTLGEPHVNSFNEFVNIGLKQLPSTIHPVEFNLPNTGKIKLNFVHFELHKPAVPYGQIGVTDTRIFPKECRQRAATYKGKLIGRIQWSINGEPQKTVDKDLGDIPIMLKSNRCNLEGLSPFELVFHGEHEQEWGGYFIINGNERLVRMLLSTRRNYPVCIKRSVWKDRGKQFSDLGIYIRCVTEDQTSTLNVLHYVTDGSARIMFSHQKLLYYVPLALTLKCLCDFSDIKIFQHLVQGFEDNLYYIDAVKSMLTTIHEENLDSQEDCKNYLGKLFRVRFYECPEWWSDIEVADFVLKECVLIHLDDNLDKFNMLVFMTQKLFMFVQDKCKVEGADSVMMQEVLLGGHLYQQVVKEKLQNWLNYMRLNLLKKTERDPNITLSDNDFASAASQTSLIDSAIQTFLSTGNITSKSGLGLLQDKGLTIMAENINRMRYMSHFRSVHRGSFFQEMRTTEARQLLPDAWGFICPVHTPDGTPCGLLNHLTSNCIITQIEDPEKINNIYYNLIELGMIPLNSSKVINFKQHYCVQLEGKIIGYINDKVINLVVHKLRVLKIKGNVIPKTTEIALIPKSKICSQYPGLFLFVGPARMMRPLKNLLINEIEYIGTLEQVYLDVAVCPEEIYKGVSTHMELSKTSFLSNLAQLIPMPDMNQSPRNMYQCQMGKQTMGTPCHNFPLQAETKLYRIQTPASPLFRPTHYDNMDLDDFAMGTNAIVAVVSYTGYDMEDAMVINKASQERGFAHGSLLKSEFIELEETQSYFCRDPTNQDLEEFLDHDGLPYIGRTLKFGEPLYCFYNADQLKYVVKSCKNKEDYYVDRVNRCGDFSDKKGRKACIICRVPRNPSVGDKFASRAGQKGICSQLWPAEDLPFTETGLMPDIIFNPHGFPSRMTIAMMVEVMAGKSAALNGLVHDATPFKFTEEDTAIDYFGKLLEAGGYNYYGTETLYSGIDGREMPARIFFGIVHYQRLRHMVSDKWQVRTTGPTDQLTRQPVHGRSKGGGIRFGEMERDALISHGMAFYLQDRLFHCSDKTVSYMCNSCLTLIGPVTEFIRVSDKKRLEEKRETCRICNSSKNVDSVEIPYIFKFFVTQLASANIKLKIGGKKI